jgi:LPS export ABC transporter protein LptC
MRLAAGGKEQDMSKLRLGAVIFVVAVATLAIWVAGNGMRTGRSGGATGEAPGSAYDYEASDVVVRQMGADGSLQYELSAKQITQQPQGGQITAQDLVMHRDPAGSEPGGPNRLTLRADRADLPEAGGVINLQGNVHAEGRPENSQALFSLATKQLAYNLETQDVSIDRPVDYSWGKSTFHCASLRMNIKLGTVVQSKCNGTFVP